MSDVLKDRVERWSPEDWEGAARMATVRKECGIPLSDVDVEALRKARANV